jgi:DNA-binding PadR family transcriptional regulator
LALLRRGPSHGYQLRVDFESVTGRSWPLNIGQVYTTLARLERDGLVVQQAHDDDDDRVTWQLTAEGDAAVREWFDHPVAPRVEARDELAIKLAVAAAVSDTDVARLIQRQRVATIAVLQDLTRLKSEARSDVGWAMVLEGARLQTEADLRWLEYCEELLAARRAPEQPAGTAAPVVPAPGGAVAP